MSTDTFEMRISHQAVVALSAAISSSAEGHPHPVFELNAPVWCSPICGGCTKTGVITAISHTVDGATQTGVWVIAGVGTEDLFAQRVCWSAMEDNWVWKTAQVTGTPEYCARSLVDKEMIRPKNPARAYPGLVLEPATAEKWGSNVPDEPYVCQASPYQTVAEVLTTISSYSRLSFKIMVLPPDPENPTGGQRLQFVTQQGVDRRNQVALSIAGGSLRAYEIMEAATETKSVAYALGRSLGAVSTMVRTDLYLGDAAPNGVARRECAIDGSASFLASGLRERARRALLDRRPKLTLRVEYNAANQTAVLGRDFALGDVITAHLGLTTVVSRVVTVTEAWDATTGRTVGLTLGQEYPDTRAVFSGIYHRIDELGLKVAQPDLVVQQPATSTESAKK
jgi:hypothetical protein